MYVVTVLFELVPGMEAKFQQAIAMNAATSLEVEPGCRQFDVCASAAEPHVVFLYEIYDDADAFELHLKSSHFLAFNEETNAFVARKTVQSYRRVFPIVDIPALSGSAAS